MSDYQRWLEGEISDSDFARLQARKVNHMLDRIKTEAGKRLWTEINENYGSSVWGVVGDGIVEIEAEVEERIIKLLDEMLAENWDWAEDCTCDGCIRINKMFALIKGEK